MWQLNFDVHMSVDRKHNSLPPIILSHVCVYYSLQNQISVPSRQLNSMIRKRNPFLAKFIIDGTRQNGGASHLLNSSSSGHKVQSTPQDFCSSFAYAKYALAFYSPLAYAFNSLKPSRSLEGQVPLASSSPHQVLPGSLSSKTHAREFWAHVSTSQYPRPAMPMLECQFLWWKLRVP